MFQMVHPAEQPGIDVADGQHAVHIRPVDADGNPDVGDLGRAGGEEKYADLPWRIAGLLDGGLPGQHGGHLHGGFERQDMLTQIRKPHPDQPHHRWTGRADYRFFQLAVGQKLTGCVRDDFRRPGDLEHLIEPHFQQPGQHDIDVVEMVELAIEGRGGDCHLPLEIFQHGQGIVPCLFGVVGADPHTFAAVDAPFRDDLGFAAPHPDGLGRAAFDAVGAANAFVFVQRDRMKEPVHEISPPLKPE